LVSDEDFAEIDGGFATVQLCLEPPRIMVIIYGGNVLLDPDASWEW